MITINPKTITPTQLREAADILDRIIAMSESFNEKRTSLGKSFAEIFGGQAEENLEKTAETTVPHRWRKKRRRISAQARARIAVAAKKRWEKARKAGRNHL